jgi:hypothetical protein
VVTPKSLRAAARAAREPVEVSMTPDQADELAGYVERLEALADTVESFVACAGVAGVDDTWTVDEVEGRGHLETALQRVRP